MRDLRNHVSKAALLIESFGTCGLTWQGDFGKGAATGSGVWSDPGANPCVLYGPVTQTTSVESFQAGYGSGAIPQVQWKPGMTVAGDSGAEFVFCKLVLSAATDLLPGQVYQWDENFNATLLTTSNSVLNEEIGVLNVFSVQQSAGTYYAWMQRAGHAAVMAAASSIATGQAESTATGGTVKFLNTHTVGAKSTDGMTAFGASSSITFTGTTTSGSPYVTAVASGNVNGGIADLQVGMVITGAGLPSNSCIAAIDKSGGQWRVSIGTATAGSWNVLQNATASGSGVTFTVTSHVAANIYWPQLKTQN